MTDPAYISRVRIERLGGPQRLAYVPAEEEPVAFGVHSEVAEHYGVGPDDYPPHATTLDYVVAAAGAFLTQVRRPGAVHVGDAVAVAAALRRRLDAVGVVHARTYDADERRYGVEGSVGIKGVHLGAGVSRTLQDAHLVAASTRGLDGVWRKRVDCLTRVRR